MPLINCKVELKLRWTKQCVLSSAGNGNNIIFTIKDTKYVPVVALSARDSQILSNFLAKDLKDQFIGMNINTKRDNKNLTNEYRYSLKSNFVGVNRLNFKLRC